MNILKFFLLLHFLFIPSYLLDIPKVIYFRNMHPKIFHFRFTFYFNILYILLYIFLFFIFYILYFILYIYTIYII